VAIQSIPYRHIEQTIRRRETDTGDAGDFVIAVGHKPRACLARAEPGQDVVQAAGKAVAEQPRDAGSPDGARDARAKAETGGAQEIAGDRFALGAKAGDAAHIVLVDAGASQMRHSRPPSGSNAEAAAERAVI